MDKKSLRQYIRNAKRQFTQSELSELSFRIVSSLMDNAELCRASNVMLYYPLSDEVDVTPLLDALYANGKVVYLPKVISDTEMTLHEYTGKHSLAKGSFGILEPSTPAVDDIGKVQVAIVPGMAFDRNCHRLGRGKGYYDRFLARNNNIYKIGVCFPFQMVKEVECDEFDVMMNCVVCN